MAKERVQRRLAAILAADVVGYSRMMSNDEAITLSRLKSLRSEIFDPKTSQFGGRIFKTTGDGALAEFVSAVEAVQCAVEIQRELAQRNADASEDQRMLLRIGISLGDVVVDGADLYGNGVNVAARMEGLAEPGGICVSGNVQEQISNTLSVGVEDLGEQSVKNINRPIRCFRIHLGPDGPKAASATISDKPAVAVLPFENMSGDPEQEFFADGLTEDIITALSLWRFFPVIARNSTFSYKGTSPDVRKVGVELGAGYVLEGSVRKSGNRVRVTAQLIDAESGHHVWAERYDRDYQDIFDLQDEITLRIAATMEPELEKFEKQRIAVYAPKELSAWECCLKGDALIEEHSAATNEEAREMFCHAIDLDPHYSRAVTGLAFTYLRDLRFWEPEDRDEWERLFAERAKRAVELDGSDAKARTMLARVYLRARDYDAAIVEARRAVECNPFDAYSNGVLGDLLVYTGHFEEGLPLIERSRLLNPMDPRAHLIDTHISLAHLGMGEFDKAIVHAREAIRRKSDFAEPRVLMASALGYLGRQEEAAEALGTFGVSALQFFEREPQYAPVTKDRIREGLRKAKLLDNSSDEGELLPLPDKPSIAVLPFQNMSGDAEQEYFSDGITEDIITALSRIRQFFVVARNTTFTYKGRSVDVRAVAHELGVRYVLEGSVRKVGNRVRITAQLVDGAAGDHLWAERYDRDLEDIFAVQDELSLTLAAAIAPALGNAELKRAQRKKPENMDAWDLYQRGLWHLNRRNPDDIVASARLFERAMDMDPNFGPAFAGYAWAYRSDVIHGSGALDAGKAKSAALRAVSLDRDDPFAHFALGNIHVTERDFEAAEEEFQAALKLNPSFADAYQRLAFTLISLGRPREALGHLDTCLRLSPRDVVIAVCYSAYCAAHLRMHEYDKAVEWGRKSIRQPIAPWISYGLLAIALSHAGDVDEARKVVEKLRSIRPDISVSYVRGRIAGTDEERTEHLLDGLRKAGLPE